jgi:ferric-dicitrate binding protein FerR (iron transport regulator)
MTNSRQIELLSRKLAGAATPEELRELQVLLAADAEAAERQKILQQFWIRQEDESGVSVEENLQKVLANLGLPGVPGLPGLPVGGKKIGFPWLRVAAAAVVILLIGAAMFWRQEKATAFAALTEKHNVKGTRSIIQLADGSKVWLNADSKMKYPELFRGGTRDVYLNGEAFFDVAKDPEHPFIIHLANGTVRVLGTSFNVRAYDNESTVETSVATGRVAFIPKYRHSGKRQDTVYLSPDHKARYLFNREELTTATTIAQDDKAWTEGRLIFRSETMEDIATELERNFGIRVVFVDEGPKSFVFTGSFGNNTLEEIMFYLSRTKNFSYKISGSELLIATSADRLP